jgi:hypothetical protein
MMACRRKGGRRQVLEASGDDLTTTDYQESIMAKRHYSADSAALPPPPSPLDLTVCTTTRPFTALKFPASFPNSPLPPIVTYVLTDACPNIGPSSDVGRRLSEHEAVRRKSGRRDIFTPLTID